MSRIVEIVAAGLVGAVLGGGMAVAGTYYEARSEFERQSASEPERFAIRGWVEGDSARVEMEGHSDMSGADYLVATDGGEVVYLVDPQEERYFAYIAAGGMAGLTEATGGLMSFELSEISSEVVGTTPGGSILGHATTRVDWRAAYQVEMKMGFGMDRAMRFEVEGQSWLASDLEADDFSMWLWNGDLKRILASIHGDRRGFPLRMKSRSKMIDPDGREEISTSFIEVTEIRSEPIAASTFEIPSHYQEVTIPGFGGGGGTGSSAAQAPEEEKQSPMKALKGLFRKKKDDG